ncbi:MAG: TetR family transcriptional regulator [Chloroflexota bacterium]
MAELALTPDQILDAAEDALRRFGPSKTTVVDVARALGVSHGTVYRHFASKAALQDAVAERWLAQVSSPLTEIAGSNGPAKERLRHWFETLIAMKQEKVGSDPELFATYRALAIEAREVVKRHVEMLMAQIEQIIASGVDEGVFTVADPAAAGRAVFDATIRFHNPAHASEWSDPESGPAFERVWTLILAGLTAR